jgi:CMP-N-acetylneuraminic acid synthetase
MDRTVLGLIPARSGSKGLPGKNVKELAGTPLIGWSIEQALDSTSIDRVVLSTDSEEFAEVGEAYGADVPFLRPAELAEDDTPSIDVALHALDTLDESYDLLALLEPTSPLRASGDLDSAVQKLVGHWGEADALVSVGEIELEHPYLVKDVDKEGRLVPFVEPDNDYHRRQQFPPAYFPYGVIYLVKTDTLRADRSFYPDRTIPYHIERWQHYEIDDIYDFVCIERIIEYFHEKTEGLP